MSDFAYRRYSEKQMNVENVKPEPRIVCHMVKKTDKRKKKNTRTMIRPRKIRYGVALERTSQWTLSYSHKLPTKLAVGPKILPNLRTPSRSPYFPSRRPQTHPTTPPDRHWLYIWLYKLGLPLGWKWGWWEVTNPWWRSVAGTRLFYFTEFSIIPEIVTMSVRDRFHRNIGKQFGKHKLHCKQTTYGTSNENWQQNCQICR